LIPAGCFARNLDFACLPQAGSSIPHSVIYNPHLISGFKEALQFFGPARMS
jgi:hypothetical protein